MCCFSVAVQQLTNAIVTHTAAGVNKPLVESDFVCLSVRPLCKRNGLSYQRRYRPKVGSPRALTQILQGHQSQDEARRVSACRSDCLFYCRRHRVARWTQRFATLGQYRRLLARPLARRVNSAEGGY